ncbi:MAG: hypothetical protein CFE24_03600 [Flavobacterium sp. BFFFF2]|nr:MAG: hypothetical protein CFE24_03600 [Flavobacterium sp. BFFFF2]
MVTKRLFDLFFAIGIGFVLLIPAFFIWIYVAILTQSSGIFMQERVGKNGKLFQIVKFRTYRKTGSTQIVPAAVEWIRRYKLDEWPQLWNILVGEMSVVGPRPDVAGYYDCLPKEDQILLQLKPGLTSAASIKYWDEEQLLKKVSNAEEYNDEVIFPDKIQINKDYLKVQSAWTDLKIIGQTAFILIKKIRYGT